MCHAYRLLSESTACLVTIAAALLGKVTVMCSMIVALQKYVCDGCTENRDKQSRQNFRQCLHFGHKRQRQIG